MALFDSRLGVYLNRKGLSLEVLLENGRKQTKLIMSKWRSPTLHFALPKMELDQWKMEYPRALIDTAECEFEPLFPGVSALQVGSFKRVFKSISSADLLGWFQTSHILHLALQQYVMIIEPCKFFLKFSSQSLWP